MFVDQVGRVPRVLRFASIAVLGVGAVLIFFGGLRVGVTYDEPLHVQRFNNYLDTGWYLGDGQVVGGEPTENMRQQYVYAPVTMSILHGIGVLTGVEQSGAAATTADAYAMRHLGIGLISLLGLWAVAAITRLVLRGWDWGVLGAAMLVAVPLWTGHSMFNVKDVSVATGYSLATLGLMVIARRDRSAAGLVRIGGPLALAAGTILCLGTRPGMWTGVAAGCALVVGYRLLRRTGTGLLGRVREDSWRYRDIGIGLAIAAVVLVAAYPKVFDSPVTALVRSALSSANFLSVQSPWTFIPSRVAFQMPLLMLGFIAVGTFVAARGVLAARRNPEAHHQQVAVVLAQMLTLPLIAIVHGASLYGDLRQVLFAAPATAVVATIGVARLVVAARARRETDRTGPPLVAALACAAITLPLVDQVLAFPYGYTAYNSLAKVAGLPVQGDYYRASGRELAPRLPVSGPIICTPEADQDGRAIRVAHVDGWVDCIEPESSPIAAYADKRRAPAGNLAPEEFWTVTFNSRGRVPENCTRIAKVSRQLVLRRLDLASLSRCRLPYLVLSTEKIAIAADSDRGYQLLDRGWFAFGVDGTTEGVGLKGSVATMTFRLAPALAGGPVVLRLTTSQEFDVAVKLGGSGVESTWMSGNPATLSIEIPPKLVALAENSNVTLALSPSVPGADGAKVLSVEVLRRSG